MNKEVILTKLNEWLINFVEVPNGLLNDWPPCPYARQARIQNKIKTVFIEDPNNLESIIENQLIYLNENDVLVFCLDSNNISGHNLEVRIDTLNKRLMYDDFVLLEDHPDNIEKLNGVIMNFNYCALVLAQRLSKLQDASIKLKEKGYYDNWPKTNLDYVVNWRNK